MTDNPIRLLPGVGPLNGPGSNEALASLIGLTIRNDLEIPRQLNVFEPLSVDRLFQNYVDHTSACCATHQVRGQHFGHAGPQQSNCGIIFGRR